MALLLLGVSGFDLVPLASTGFGADAQVATTEAQEPLGLFMGCLAKQPPGCRIHTISVRFGDFAAETNQKKPIFTLP